MDEPRPIIQAKTITPIASHLKLSYSYSASNIKVAWYIVHNFALKNRLSATLG